MTSIYDWSMNAAGNGNADTLINWQEGQPPSTVNNSARAMMQRLREFISDLGGGIIAQGTANAINLTPSAPVNAHVNGIVLRFRAVAVNTGNVTVNVNGLGAKPLATANSRGLVALGGGELQVNGIYEIVYYSALYNNTGGWFLTNPTAAQSVPSGTISAFGMATPPSGWLKCNGAAVSRATYANLFAAIGTTWGVGNGSSTFNLPDLRGMFLRGFDDGRGLDSGRAFASSQDDQNKAHNHGGATGGAGGHNHTVEDRFATSAGNIGGLAWGGSAFPSQTNPNNSETRTTSSVGNHSHTINSDGGAEARPKNVALTYAIKY